VQRDNLVRVFENGRRLGKKFEVRKDFARQHAMGQPQYVFEKFEVRHCEATTVPVENGVEQKKSGLRVWHVTLSVYRQAR
jgi:hypothetical protein